MNHELKSWPRFFSRVVAGEKVHELRRNDRAYSVGDILTLREFDPEMQRYSGRRARVMVTYLTSEECTCAESEHALAPGFVIMSIRLLDE
jgi:hypothetical protein